MTELTPWKPLGENITHPVRQRLLAALRSALPTGDVCAEREHVHGQVQDVHYPLLAQPPAPKTEGSPDAGVPDPDTVVLATLSWRLIEFLSYNNRDMGQWNYQGVAWIDQKRVDFSGSYLRDLTTGGFWEFELKTVGV